MCQHGCENLRSQRLFNLQASIMNKTICIADFNIFRFGCQMSPIDQFYLFKIKKFIWYSPNDNNPQAIPISLSLTSSRTSFQILLSRNTSLFAFLLFLLALTSLKSHLNIVNNKAMTRPTLSNFISRYFVDSVVFFRDWIESHCN